MATTQKRVRLSIDVAPQARRRLNIAAARRDQSIRDYVWEAVETRLELDGIGHPSDADLTALNEHSDPLLGQLWNNPDDRRYDDL